MQPADEDRVTDASIEQLPTNFWLPANFWLPTESDLEASPKLIDFRKRIFMPLLFMIPLVIELYAYILARQENRSPLRRASLPDHERQLLSGHQTKPEEDVESADMRKDKSLEVSKKDPARFGLYHSLFTMFNLWAI